MSDYGFAPPVHATGLKDSPLSDSQLLETAFTLSTLGTPRGRSEPSAKHGDERFVVRDGGAVLTRGGQETDWLDHTNRGSRYDRVIV